MANEELLAWLWLAAAFPFGSVKPAELLSAYPDACALYADRKKCAAHFDWLTPSEREGLLSRRPEDFAGLLERCNRTGIKIVAYSDPLFPARLKTVDCPPVVLYCQGRLSVLHEKLCISVVGTRTPSGYSRRVADYLGRELALRGACVLSGCSEGVDADVHRGALQTGMTAAVLSCPLDQNYPASNEGLKRDILRRGGVLLSEFPPGTAFFPEQFVLRNRLLSALSDGVVVVEASEKSGSLSTARAANDQGREVFCIPPADIFNPRYSGVKPLVRDGAHNLYNVKEIFDEFRYQPAPGTPSAAEESPFRPDLSALEGRAAELYRAMPDDPMDPGCLSAKTGFSVPDLMPLLTELELNGAVVKTAGRYQKVF